MPCLVLAGQSYGDMLRFMHLLVRPGCKANGHRGYGQPMGTEIGTFWKFRNCKSQQFCLGYARNITLYLLLIFARLEISKNEYIRF